MNQSKIFGYENVTRYLHFAENPIRFNPVGRNVNFCKECQESIFVQVLTNCRLTYAQNEFKLLLNGREMKLPP